MCLHLPFFMIIKVNYLENLLLLQLVQKNNRVNLKYIFRSMMDLLSQPFGLNSNLIAVSGQQLLR